MPKAPKTYRLYRALLYLYPKAHRRAYGEQMVQTLDDILTDQHHLSEKIMVWIRVGAELPLNVIEENLNTIGEIRMGKLTKVPGKQLAIGTGVVTLVITGLILSFTMRQTSYSPTMLANVKRAAHLPACLQKTTNRNLMVSTKDQTFIENTAAGSILDVQAGTNVSAYFKTYDGKTATGSSVYSGTYGSYNFTAERVNPTSTDTYEGGWKITRLEACQ